MTDPRLADLALAELATACDLIVSRGTAVSIEEQEPPASAHRRFLLFSLSKTITAVATIAAAELAGLRLETRVATLVPAFGSAGKEEVTIHDVLCHRGGFPDGRPGLPTLTLADFDDEERALAAICRLPRDPELATRGVYHPLAYSILAYVVAAATGRQFAEFCRERILDPLDMRDTTWGLARELRGEAVALVGERASEWDVESVYAATIAAGNAWSTAADVHRLFSMFAAGGTYCSRRVLSEESVMRMTSPQAPAAGQAGARSFGYGLFIGSAPGVLSGRGKTASTDCFGHAGFTATQAWYDPRDDLTLVALTNGCVDQEASDRRFSALADTARRRA